MELDELKKYLNNRETQITPKVEKNENLSKLLKSNSKSPIDKIKNSLIFEIILTILLICLFTYGVAVVKIWSIKMYILAVLIICLLFIVPLLSFYNRIQRLSNEVLSVKANLEVVYSLMRKFVKMYFQITMGMIPIFFTIAFTLGFVEGKQHEIPEFEIFHKQFHNPWIIWIIIIIYIISTCIGMYYFTKWYLNKLYGRYIDELKIMLDELDSN